MRIGLLGYGKAGRAVASVLTQTPGLSLCWVMRRQSGEALHMDGHPHIPLVSMEGLNWGEWLDANPVDAVVDFSAADAVYSYSEALSCRQIMLVSAISAYTPEHMKCLQAMGASTRVMSSPNITLGINFLLLAAKLLRSIAPFADVEIVEQHFREKPEVSGTASRIAEVLNLEEGRVTSLRVGGIVGHHEVIFGFPHQTVRLIHDSIRREAFGTGAVYALQALRERPVGFYTFDDLLLAKIRTALLSRT